jgi:UDP:flavonoid glycosyltransferase YjiC (YdhE family)
LPSVPRRILQPSSPLPPGVRVERWVNQDEVLARAAVVVCHGGYGTMIGALAAGTPFVVISLFASDQC